MFISSSSFWSLDAILIGYFRLGLIVIWLFRFGHNGFWLLSFCRLWPWLTFFTFGSNLLILHGFLRYIGYVKVWFSNWLSLSCCGWRPRCYTTNSWCILIFFFIYLTLHLCSLRSYNILFLSNFTVLSSLTSLLFFFLFFKVQFRGQCFLLFHFYYSIKSISKI